MKSQSDVRTVLFITSSRIGDAVLSSGLLKFVHEHYPNAKVTICCGPLATSLFEGYPNLERIIPIKKQKYNKHWFNVWRAVFGQKFDVVIDLRNSIVSRFIPAKVRHIYGGHIDKSQHKVMQNAQVMKLSGEDVYNPALWFTQEQMSKARGIISDEGAVLAVGPSANWAGKTWPSERFIEVIDWMISDGGLMERARVAVFAAPGEEEVANTVLNSIPEDKRIDVIAKADPGTAAACLSLCNFYLGNDSGLMHCAAAVGVPTIGVFGPSYPHLYAPWGGHCSYVSTPETFDELIDYEGYSAATCGCLMETLSVGMVKEAIKKNWPK